MTIRVPDPASSIPSHKEAGSVALVTASYAPDFERCRLLCETVDRHLKNVSRHYILVAGSDVARFKALETPQRHVIDERELLPSWLHSFRDPLSLLRRRIWLSFRTKPLRGWHVQQLRRMAVASLAKEDALLFCDSDVAMVRDFDCADFWRDGRIRLFRRTDALKSMVGRPQVEWSRHAGTVLGIPDGQTSDHDYIATFITWRREAVLAMLGRIEETAGVHWVEAIGSSRAFSECMIYGRHADEVMLGRDHWLADEELCRIYWDGPSLGPAGLRDFVAGLSEGQVAVGLQSFTGTDIEDIRRAVS